MIFPLPPARPVRALGGPASRRLHPGGHIGSPVVTRRIAVLTAGVVLLVLFGVLGTRCRCPTSPRCPGRRSTRSATSTGSPIITVTGREPNHVSGNLNLTTVGISSGGLSLVQPSGLVRQRGQPSSPRSRSTRRASREQETRRGQPAGLPHLRAGGRERGAGAARLPDEGRRPGGLPKGSPSAASWRRATRSWRSTARPRPTRTRSPTSWPAIPAGTTVTGRLHPARAARARRTVTTEAGAGPEGSVLGVLRAATALAPRSTSTST